MATKKCISTTKKGTKCKSIVIWDNYCVTHYWAKIKEEKNKESLNNQ